MQKVLLYAVKWVLIGFLVVMNLPHNTQASDGYAWKGESKNFHTSVLSDDDGEDDHDDHDDGEDDGTGDGDDGNGDGDDGNGDGDDGNGDGDDGTGDGDDGTGDGDDGNGDGDDGSGDGDDGTGDGDDGSDDGDDGTGDGDDGNGDGDDGSGDGDDGDDGSGDGDDGTGDGDDGSGDGDDGNGDGDDGTGDGDDDDGKNRQRYGIIENIPDSPHYGVWTIGNIVYHIDANTRLESDHGTFGLGTCVEVKYATVQGVNIAQEIESEHSYKCGTSSGDDDGKAERHQHIYGILQEFPVGLTGVWIIDTIQLTATTSTHFEQEKGTFFVGGCVDAKYLDTTLVEVSTTNSDNCQTGGSEDDEHPPHESKFYGIISNVPVQQVGLWTIGDTTFTTTEQTKFEQEDGIAFANGVCAEVAYYLLGNAKMATKIETTESYQCSNGTATNRVYGTIVTAPSALYGTWVVQTQSYTPTIIEATVQTRFDAAPSASFVRGACINVTYHTMHGISYADKITLEASTYCQQDDQGSNPPTFPGTYKVYATIDQFPDPYIDRWIIGGVTYQTTDQTIFNMEHGVFAVGACVKGTYTMVAGEPTLLKVETKKTEACQDQDGEPIFRSYGMVDSFPADYQGDWLVGGVRYQAITTTLFEQAHGFFSVGAHVEITYRLDDQHNRNALTIHTHVSSAGGREHAVVRFDAYDQETETWQADGKVYHSDPVLDVDLPDDDDNNDDGSSDGDDGTGDGNDGTGDGDDGTGDGDDGTGDGDDGTGDGGDGDDGDGDDGTGDGDDGTGDGDDGTGDGDDGTGDGDDGDDGTGDGDDGDTTLAAMVQQVPASGEIVWINYYETTDGTRYATYITQVEQVFMPLVRR